VAQTVHAPRAFGAGIFGSARAMQRTVRMSPANTTKPSLWTRLLVELKAYWLIFIYLAVFFGVFATFQRLLLAHYGVPFEEYGFAIIKALVLAKVILIAEKLGLGGRFRGKPLSIPTLYDTFVFTLCVAVVHFAEVAIKHLIHVGASGLGQALVGEIHLLFAAHVLVVFFSFIPFFAVRELTRVLGEGTLSHLFFMKRLQ
jgi:hypothetical protein